MFKPSNGRHLGAVNGGGIGGPNVQPMHSDAVMAGPWELSPFVSPEPA